MSQEDYLSLRDGIGSGGVSSGAAMTGTEFNTHDPKINIEEDIRKTYTNK